MNYIETHPHYCHLDVLNYEEGRLVLVEPELKHAESSISWTSDDSVVQYMGISFDHPSLEGEKKRIAEIRAIGGKE